MLCFVFNSATICFWQETTLFLQMLYNPQFKQQYSEELMKHYQTMIESVIDRNIREYDSHVKLFKALDSSLERGGLPNIEIAEVSCKKYCLLLILTVAHDSLCVNFPVSTILTLRFVCCSYGTTI
jgi:hypothetical protein